MWTVYPFERLVFKNVKKILLINIWIFIPLLVYMWGVEGVTGLVAYQIALPLSLSNLHNIFHVSQLRKYIHDPSHVIKLDDIQVKENWT